MYAPTARPAAPRPEQRPVPSGIDAGDPWFGGAVPSGWARPSWLPRTGGAWPPAQVCWAFLAPPEADTPPLPAPPAIPPPPTPSTRLDELAAERALLRQTARGQLARLTDPADRAIARCALDHVRRLHYLRWHPTAHGFHAADRGAVGKHLERLIAADLGRRRRWQFHLTINDTSGRILSVGRRPGGAGLTTQIDAVFLRPGAPRYQPGERFDPARLEHAYEIKANAHGRVDAGQRRRIARLLEGRPLRLIHASVARFCPAEGRWVVNERFRSVLVVLKAPPPAAPSPVLAAASGEWAPWPLAPTCPACPCQPAPGEPEWLARARRLACALPPDDSFNVAIASASQAVPPTWYALCRRHPRGLPS